jgi:hypothetical protein
MHKSVPSVLPHVIGCSGCALVDIDCCHDNPVFTYISPQVPAWAHVSYQPALHLFANKREDISLLLFLRLCAVEIPSLLLALHRNNGGPLAAPYVRSLEGFDD